MFELCCFICFVKSAATYAAAVILPAVATGAASGAAQAMLGG